MSSTTEILRTVALTELRQLARDRRALFAAVLLPALLYPLLFWGSQKLETVGRDTMAKREVAVLVDFARADGGAEGEVARRARLALAEREPITISEVDAAALLELAEAAEADSRDEGADAGSSDGTGADDDADAPAPGGAPPDEAALRAAALDRIGDDADLLVTARTRPVGADGATPRTLFEVWYDVQDDTAREGRERARDALRSLTGELRAEARERLLGGDPGAGLEPRLVDLATAEDASGAALGRWLPFLAMLVLLSGGAYAALAVFAGEREAGTLETLLVQPVAHHDLARGKFVAVLVAGLVTVAVNLTSLVVCASTGLAEMPGFEGSGGSGLPLERLALAGFVLLPACALLCALLCLGCGRAKTFREGQMLVLPVTFLVIIPTAIVLRPEASLGVLWAVVPFAGSGLALREALEGDLTLPLAALVMATHAAWTWLLLGRVAAMLDGERALRDADGAAAGTLRHRAAAHAQLAAFTVVMSLYLVAQSVQRADLDVGLVVTFWVMLPLFALGIARLAPRPADRPWTADLGLRAPAPWHLVGALCLTPALALAAQEWIAFQFQVLPMPRQAAEADGLGGLFEGRSTGWLFFFLALSPGLWEELVFRGSLLSSMRRGMSTVRLVLFQGLWFALAHASVYRLAPTFVLGALFAIVALRARSVWPTVLAHVGYNALVSLGASGRLPEWATRPELAWLALPGVVLLALPGARRA